MPALTAYPPPSAHGAGWPPLKTEPSFSQTSPSCSASIPTVSSSLTARRTSSNKTHLGPFTEPPSSPVSRLNPSKPSIRPIVPAHPSPQVILRGILTKPSSTINPSIVPAIIPGSPALLIPPPHLQPLPSSSSSVQPITKKVRFSGELASGTRLSSSGCGQHSCLEPCTRRTETNGPQVCRRPEPPVIETIFLTYSRAAYDRSPITVDRLLNKSLALPPRTEDDKVFMCGTRWLAELLPTPPSEPSNLPPKPLCPTELLPNHLEPEILLPALGSSHSFNPHQILLTVDPPQAVHWQTPSDLLPQWHSEDGVSESTGSSSSQDPATPIITDLLPSLLPPIPLPLPPDHRSLAPSSLSVENLAHHALSNLSLTQSSLSCQSIDLDPICGLGNWTRAQVFDSCDALDGF